MLKAANLKVGDELVCLEDLLDRNQVLYFAKGKKYTVAGPHSSHGIWMNGENGNVATCSEGDWLDKFELAAQTQTANSVPTTIKVAMTSPVAANAPAAPVTMLNLKAGDEIKCIETIGICFFKGDTYKIARVTSQPPNETAFQVVGACGAEHTISESAEYWKCFCPCAAAKPERQVRLIDDILADIWDAHKTRNVPQALLDEYKALTGKDRPAFLA
jgi:hypothetical protein